ncbi:MAG: OB-fold domain-containing protein [Candidatus Rokubacteria bacterium]|nr:OB-fold domain-containing protein [Candidatus Rokubacteria bacterium]
MTYAKPLPTIDDDNRPFWEALTHGELRLQRCLACGHHRYPIAPACPRCLAAEHEWTRLSGRGRVFSYVVFHHVYHEAFRPDVPYNVALVQLDEGPFMFSNVVGVPNEALRCDLPVTVVFDRVTEAVTLPRFRPLEDP